MTYGGSPLDRVRQSLALGSHNVDFLLTWPALSVIPGLPRSLSAASAEASSLWILSHPVSELRKALREAEKVPWQVQSGISLLLGVVSLVIPGAPSYTSSQSFGLQTRFPDSALVP